MIENLQASPQDFYASIEKAIEKREIPHAKMSRKLWPEGGLFSARREYLRVRRREHTIDICGAPFGAGFFASSWLSVPGPHLLLAIVMIIVGSVVGFGIFNDIMGLDPFQTFRYQVVRERVIPLLVMLGLDVLFVILVVIFGIIRPLFFPPRATYYRIDTAEMFFAAVHQSVLEVIDGISSAQGLRLLSEDERKPIMRGFGR